MTSKIDLARVTNVGVDLDLTLIDTRAATAVALRRVNERCGETIDVDAFIERLGLPMRDELARSMPAERVDRALDVFRSAFLDEGIELLAPLPGALRLAEGLPDTGRSLVVITSRVPPIAAACLDACGLAIDHVVGNVTGPEKVAPIIDHKVGIYVGDHPLDMRAATEANVPGIGVTTGAHSPGELRDAGADWVIASLDELASALL
jgi:phosphoglycolate phosphatase